jgi:hypothetical protein
MKKLVFFRQIQYKKENYRFSYVRCGLSVDFTYTGTENEIVTGTTGNVVPMKAITSWPPGKMQLMGGSWNGQASTFYTERRKSKRALRYVDTMVILPSPHPPSYYNSFLTNLFFTFLYLPPITFHLCFLLT